jgi:cystathionine gamma-synthase
MRFETLAVHAGHRPDPATGGVAAPIHLATTFERDPDGSFPRGYVYARNANPTRDALEACVADLEGGAAAVAFASGSAATAAVFQALAPGDHLVAPYDAYYGTGRMLRETWSRWGLETTFVDMTAPEEVERAVRDTTRVVWVESPSNPLWKVADIARIAEIARRAGARCVCDSTPATPVLQRPLALGADLVMHSTTKYLGGHGDSMGGVLVTRVADDFFSRLKGLQASLGAFLAPFDSWLVMRGIRTLPLRMRAHSEHALRVATFLASHPRAEAVHYPGLPSHPGHAVARRQMSGFGGMISLQVTGAAAEAMAVANKLRVFTRATSFGGTESLVEHRASIEGPGTHTPGNLLRLSIGLEHPDDLVEDLQQALG